MTINYVNNEMLWFQNPHRDHGDIFAMLVVEGDE